MDIKKIAVIILIILILGIGGYFVWKNFSGSTFAPGHSPLMSPLPSDNISLQAARDERRIRDLFYLSEKINAYKIDHDGYAFVAGEWQKISDEQSAVFRALKDNGFLDKALKDPMPDKYYYGYRSDGYMYELSAILENKNSGKCEISGNLCVYKIKKGTEPLFNEDYPDGI